MGCFHAYTKMS